MSSAKQTKAASIFNKAFDSTQLGGDGVVLASTAHPLQSGSTQVNTFTNTSRTFRNFFGRCFNWYCWLY